MMHKENAMPLTYAAPFDYTAAPEFATFVSIAYGDVNWGYIADGESLCSTCDKRPAVVIWDGGMDSSWECAECMQESMRQSDMQTWLAHADAPSETLVTDAAQAVLDSGESQTVLNAEARDWYKANHRYLVDELGYPYGGNFVVVHVTGLVETWFQGDAQPCTVQTVEEYNEAVFCWSNDC